MLRRTVLLLLVVFPILCLSTSSVLADADLATTTERVSVSSAEAEGNGESSGRLSISADGRYVAFRSYADNLVARDTNGSSDIFVRDRVTGETERVSISSAEAEGNNDSWRPSISADGRYVAFSSFADNLVAGDTNDWQDGFVRDRVTGGGERFRPLERCHRRQRCPPHREQWAGHPSIGQGQESDEWHNLHLYCR